MTHFLSNNGLLILLLQIENAEILNIIQVCQDNMNFRILFVMLMKYYEINGCTIQKQSGIVSLNLFHGFYYHLFFTRRADVNFAAGAGKTVTAGTWDIVI